MDNAQTTAPDNSAGLAERHGGEDLVHVVPVHVLVAVWAALLVLTVITVAVTYVDLGSANLWLAILIATVKASLVALYFMHLRYDQPFYGLILIAALLFITLFIGMTLLDSAQLLPEKIVEELPES
jgi:cytochrome c oxidase subunit IV